MQRTCFRSRRGLTIPLAAVLFAAGLASHFRASAATTTTVDRYPVETIVYRAVAASLKGDSKTVHDSVDKLEALDRALEAQGREPTGCTDNMAWLWAESLGTPNDRLTGYEMALDRRPDELVKTNLETALNQALPEQIRATRHQDTWNRWADLFNALGFNIGRLLNGQVVGSAQFLIELVYSPSQFTKITERERKEWWLLDTMLRLNPKSPLAPDLRAQMARLEARFRKDSARRCMEVAHFYADKGWWREAYFYVRAADEAGFGGQRGFRRDVMANVANETRWITRSLQVADTENLLRRPEQRQAYGALLQSLALGNREKLRQSILSGCRALDGTALADDAEETWSVLFEWMGDRRQALEREREVALRHPDTLTGQVALARLEDPQYNPRAEYDREKAKFRGRQTTFLLTGERSTKQNLMLVSQMASPSPPRMGTAGAFFVTDMLVRSILMSFGNPISPEDVLASGEHLLEDPRNGLTPEEQASVRVDLGVRYQRLRRYDDATAAYRKARILTAELHQDLDEKAAEEQYRKILDVEGVNNQILLLDKLIKTYPKTQKGGEARDQLKRLQTASKIDFEISYDWLAEDPAHWMKLGVRIPYDLMDGSKGNGELDEHGLVFWLDRPTPATYVCQDGKKGQVNLTPQRRAILKAAAEQWVDRKATLEEGEITMTKSRMPFEVRGSVGGQGLIVFPTLRQAPLSDDEKRMFR